MKTKIFLFFSAGTFFLFFIPAIAKAQFSKRDMLLEGAIGNISYVKGQFQNENPGALTTLNKDFTFSVSLFPRIGFFVGENLVIGATLGIGFNSNKNQSIRVTTGKISIETKASSIALGILPFVRYYLPAKKTRTHFYVQAGGGFNIYLAEKSNATFFDTLGAVNYKYVNHPKKHTSFSGEALVGLNHFISRTVAINAAIGYRYNYEKQTNFYTTELIGGASTTADPDKYTIKTSTLSWNIGFTIIIPSKKGNNL